MTNGTLPFLPDALSPLRDLALDLRWTWSHEADALWSRIGGDLWELTRNPWGVLQELPAARLTELAKDAEVLGQMRDLAAKQKAYLQSANWFEGAHKDGLRGQVAYFSLEYGLGEALPIYAGGLGMLAGDFLKSASDLGMPVIGVGLLYQEGYFRQVLDAEGGQRETYPFNDPSMLPVVPAVLDDAWLRIPIEMAGRTLNLRVWQALVGRVKLYLLDSNDLLNTPADRGITGKLYGGDAEMRLMQEIVLGVGGWRALEALGHEVEVCHLNEGHAAFVVIERALRLSARGGLDFRQALWATRAGNVFTTHTPVAAGFDRFDPDVLVKHLAHALGPLEDRGASMNDILALGRANPEDEAEPFNMAYLATHGSGVCLGVSRLHGEVSRGVFQPLFRRWPREQVPVDYVTNGVHIPSWDSAGADRMWARACGEERWRVPAGTPGEKSLSVSDEDIWSLRDASRRDLVDRVRHRLRAQLRGRGLEPARIEVVDSVFDPNILTVGFARRFTEYKRPNLLLRDPDRLARLVFDEHRPLQIVVAGKAHPADEVGKGMIKEWIELARQPRFRRHVVFLEDYDIALAQELVHGVDVWINTPRRPWEACGTSGMKVLVNGGLNCSVRDGWWDEAYTPDVGWSIGGPADEEGAQVDAAAAAETYDLLERSIAPEFYDRDPTGLPRAWCARIRASLTALTPTFSSGRMARDYAEKAYLPAAAALRRRSEDDHAAARDLADWSDRVARAWPTLHIEAPTFARAGDCWRVSVPVLLGELAPDDVAIELYADSVDADPPSPITLKQQQAIPGALNGYVFMGEAPAARPAGDFTVRAIPRHAEAQVPAELALITWQR